jgi:hypothetical protein
MSTVQKIQNKMGLKINDLCIIRNEWISSQFKSKRCKIISFEKHGFIIFARVRWMSPDAYKLKEQVGCIFPLDELVKV